MTQARVLTTGLFFFAVPFSLFKGLPAVWDAVFEKEETRDLEGIGERSATTIQVLCITTGRLPGAGRLAAERNRAAVVV